MYKDEKVIEGRLCWRSNPKGEWKPYSAEELSAMVVELRARARKAEDALDCGSV